MVPVEFCGLCRREIYSSIYASKITAHSIHLRENAVIIMR